MFNKKSVIGGLLLSASTLGVVGGAVATQNAMEAPVQKHAESQNERAIASSKSRNLTKPMNLPTPKRSFAVVIRAYCVRNSPCPI